MTSDEPPERTNFYSTLNTKLTRQQIAAMYGSLGWTVRKCSTTDYEIFGPWCELVIEAESPILMHGFVADPVARSAELVAPLRTAKVSFTAEFYGPDDQLMLELHS